MLNDKQLEDLSYEIDEFLVKCSNKYKVGTLSLSAVTLARLIRAVEAYGDRQDFEAASRTLFGMPETTFR